MHRLSHLIPLLLITLLLSMGAAPVHVQAAPSVAAQAAPSVAAQAAPSLAAQAETMRTSLLQAQMALTADPAAAAAQIDAATVLYELALSPQLAIDAPQSNVLVRTALARAAQAAASGDGVALAAARATAWTALLNGAYLTVSAAITRGDYTLAAQWLLVREYRQATRFARPNGDVSTAMAGLASGSIASEEVLRILDADLLDTYQARLSDSLRAAAEADSQGFALRRAELAAGAAGYFAMLEPAYSAQRGAAPAAAATDAFAAFAATATHGESVAAQLPALDALLNGFRAAPLAPREQARRAAQMVRYLALASVEYGRGVHGNTVTSALEVREAATFFAGANAAFEDLRSELDADAPQATKALQDQFGLLGEQLAAAARGSSIASPNTIRAETEELLRALRNSMPAAWQRQESGADFDVINTTLEQMMQAADQGDLAAADSARLEAYAILESGPEARLIAFAPRTVPALEGLFWYGNDGGPGLAALIAQAAPADQIRAAGNLLVEQLNAANAALGGSADPSAIALNAALIVFREGLEAVVILAALLASMVGARKVLRRPMAIGVILAFVASGVTWWLMQTILSQFRAYGEKLEAVVSLIAIGVLLLITNWFFHRVYWKEWMAGLHSRKKELMGGVLVGQSLGFILLGFTSVYREGFETVLFMQALVLNGGLWPTLEGVALGMAGVVAVGLLTFTFQSHLPYKQMLVWTGILIGAVLLVMVGNTAHVFQLVGWLPLHPVRWLTLPYWAGMWFGLYPTWEGFALQGLAAAFVIGSYFLAEATQRRQSAKPAQHAPFPAPTGGEGSDANLTAMRPHSESATRAQSHRQQLPTG